VLVTTYRKDGRAVPTPVWVVRDGDGIAIWTASDSGKVKRVRRDGAVLVGPCTAGGKLTGAESPSRPATRPLWMVSGRNGCGPRCAASTA
jgi:PPOX class probable F420-dependent enzyme